MNTVPLDVEATHFAFSAYFVSCSASRRGSCVTIQHEAAIAQKAALVLNKCIKVNHRLRYHLSRALEESLKSAGRGWALRVLQFPFARESWYLEGCRYFVRSPTSSQSNPQSLA